MHDEINPNISLVGYWVLGKDDGVMKYRWNNEQQSVKILSKVKNKHMRL